MKGISITHLDAGYGKELICKDVSFDLDHGTLALMGPSGCGKSTLLLAIMGILKPLKGTITIGGRDVTRLAIEERNIGYVPQDFGLFAHLDVFDNIAYGLRVRGVGKKEQIDTVHDMLGLVDLMDYRNNTVKSLSGGQKQRVALARALVIQPSVLLLDEPLSNVDQLTKFEVATQLQELFTKFDIPIILVSHNQQDALFFADTLAIMIEGRIEQIGTPDEILRAPKTETIKKLLSPLYLASKTAVPEFSS